MAVSRFLATIFLLLFQTRNKMTLGHREKDFFTDCPPSKCGKGGPEIRYPFRRESSPPNCGARDLVLSCSGNDTLLSLPESGSLKVIAIDYKESLITIKLGKPWSDCQVQNFSSTSLTTPVYEPRDIFSLVNCSKEWNRGSAISCLSSVDHYVYMADIRMPVVLLPSDCVVVSTNLVMGTGVEREEHWKRDERQAQRRHLTIRRMKVEREGRKRSFQRQAHSREGPTNTPILALVEKRSKEGLYTTLGEGKKRKARERWWGGRSSQPRKTEIPGVGGRKERQEKGGGMEGPTSHIGGEKSGAEERRKTKSGFQ
ncbi:hypothetical protein COCNU_05G009410 [Cocos nucifera]|uniref:RING-type E3 ubiquitin transferase n=1 Tax=Cocos nucifera TaxID=13894 RepID=A0A8K0I973_COCNU|nr:hypothetical protein COCNU_05G009410 [Cocos nucifera]